MTDSNEKYIKIKKERREKKRANKRNATAEEVIFIFEKVLEDWKTIRIFNTIVQNNPKSELLKKNVENISTGNCKVNRSELCEERFNYYNELRGKVYEKKGIVNIENTKISLFQD
jgi:3-dehydroquinate synthase class II